MTHPLLELIALALPQLTEVTCLARRAEILRTAADACASAGLGDEAAALHGTAAELRQADQAQLKLTEIFSTHRF